MSGGGGGDTIVNQSGPPAWAVPHYQNYLGRAEQTANQPYTPYTGQRVAQPNATQYSAMDAITQRATQGTPEASAGRDMLTRTLQGGYLAGSTPTNPYTTQSNPYGGSNPYLQQNIDAALGDVTRAYDMTVKPGQQAAAVRSGSFGNTGLAEMQGEQQRQLAGELGRVSSGMRMADYTQQQGLAENELNRRFSAGESLAGRTQTGYENERSRMMAGLGLVPEFGNMDYTDAAQMLNVGDILQRQNQANLDDDYSRFTEARDYPIRQLDILGRALGGTNFGQTSTQTNPNSGSNSAAQAAGGLMALYALYGMGR